MLERGDTGRDNVRRGVEGTRHGGLISSPPRVFLGAFDAMKSRARGGEYVPPVFVAGE